MSNADKKNNSKQCPVNRFHIVKSVILFQVNTYWICQNCKDDVDKMAKNFKNLNINNGLKISQMSWEEKKNFIKANPNFHNTPDFQKLESIDQKSFLDVYYYLDSMNNNWLI